MRWYVLNTKPRSEKKVAKILGRFKIRAFCPTITEVHQWSDRKKKVNYPLFRSYVFVRLLDRDRHKVFAVPGVVKYLYWLGKPATVRDEEINTIKKWLNNRKVEEIVVEQLSARDKVKVLSRALKDEEALIREIQPNRIRLFLLKLGCAVSVRIGDDENDPVGVA